MARPQNQQPTDVELEILSLLWKSGPMELGPLCAAMREVRPVATTTVATMLGVMINKGLAKRTKGDKGWKYSAVVSREDAAKDLVRKLVDRAFDGSASLLVSHLLDRGELTADERKQIIELLREESSSAKKSKK
jgi:BlaI family transcriptional regulator, penicillinase repressor